MDTLFVLLWYKVFLFILFPKTVKFNLSLQLRLTAAFFSNLIAVLWPPIASRRLQPTKWGQCLFSLPPWILRQYIDLETWFSGNRNVLRQNFHIRQHLNNRNNTPTLVLVYMQICIEITIMHFILTCYQYWYVSTLNN